MTVSAALLPIAAATASVVARGVSDVLKQGASFADLLLSPRQETPSNTAAAAHPDADATLGLTNDSRVARWKTAWQNVTAQTAALHQLLVEKFTGQGIDLSEPIVLRTDTAGRLLTAAGHPQRAAIEQSLESDSTLANQVRQMFQQVADLDSSSSSEEPPSLSDIRLVVQKDRAFFAHE